MWKLVALVLLLCAGCEASEFYQQNTKEWFSNQPPTPAKRSDDAPHGP